MLNDEICKLRDKLNKSIEQGDDYNITYKLVKIVHICIINFRYINFGYINFGYTLTLVIY